MRRVEEGAAAGVAVRAASVGIGAPPLAMGVAARTPQAVLALQRAVGNAAVGAVVQRCGPVPCDCPAEEKAAREQEAGGGAAVQREVAPGGPAVQREGAAGGGPVVQRQDGGAAGEGLPVVPAPVAAGATHLERWLAEERDAGLLDLPWRGNVPEIPALPGTAPVAPPPPAGASMAPTPDAPLGPVPGTPGGPPPGMPPQPVGPVPRTPTGPVPETPAEPVPSTAARPGLGFGAGLALAGFELVAAIGAGLAVFFYSTHAPAWRDETSISGWGFDSEAEWTWWHRTLDQQQREYLIMLSKVRREKKDVGADASPDPFAVPGEAAGADGDKKRAPTCLSLPVPRRGGNARHDAYATKVTRGPLDHFVRTPAGLAITYDGRSDGLLVWEVKTGHGWMFDPESHALALRIVAEWDAQRRRGLDVADACGYQHVWSVSDRWIRESLLVRWGGSPFVFNIPE